MQGSAVNADLSGPLLGIRRPGKLIPMAKWSKEAKAQRKRMVAAVGKRVAGKSYRQVVEVEREGAAWLLGLPDSPVFPAPLANYDWRRFDQPQLSLARNKKITVDSLEAGNFALSTLLVCLL